MTTRQPVGQLRRLITLTTPSGGDDPDTVVTAWAARRFPNPRDVTEISELFGVISQTPAIFTVRPEVAAGVRTASPTETRIMDGGETWSARGVFPPTPATVRRVDVYAVKID